MKGNTQLGSHCRSLFKRWRKQKVAETTVDVEDNIVSIDEDSN